MTAKTERILSAGPVTTYLAQQRKGGEFRVLVPRDTLNQTQAAKYGLELVSGYHPGIYGRYLDLYKAIWKSDISESTALQEHTLADIAHPVILDLMNVEYMVPEPAERTQDAKKPTVRHAEDSITIFRRESALPRACIVPRADTPAPGTPLLDALCAINPKAGCLVEDRPFQGGDPYRPLPLERKSPSDVTLRFKSEKGGVVLLSQAWHPDWRATDHGKSVEVRRVNYDFVGVCVGPGEHEIRVWYMPWDFYLGCCVAALAWGLLALAGIWTVWKRRNLATPTAEVI